MGGAIKEQTLFRNVNIGIGIEQPITLVYDVSKFSRSSVTAIADVGGTVNEFTNLSAGSVVTVDIRSLLQDNTDYYAGFQGMVVRSINVLGFVDNNINDVSVDLSIMGILFKSVDYSSAESSINTYPYIGKKITGVGGLNNFPNYQYDYDTNNSTAIEKNPILFDDIKLFEDLSKADIIKIKILSITGDVSSINLQVFPIFYF